METLTDDLMQQFLQFVRLAPSERGRKRSRGSRRERERETAEREHMVKMMIMLFKMMIVAAPLSGSDICSQHPL